MRHAAFCGARGEGRAARSPAGALRQNGQENLETYMPSGYTERARGLHPGPKRRGEEGLSAHGIRSREVRETKPESPITCSTGPA